MLRYQRGDGEAFDELYRRYYPRLRLYCARRVGDRHVAEELAQEAFLRALRAMPSFAGERRFYPWMTVIAQRLCIDHHRRSARVQPSADVDTGTVEADHDAVFVAVDHGHVNEAMTRVTPRHREVLRLREQQGWTYNQIADELGVPVTTVEALLHRARKSLRREFLAVSSGTRLASLPVLGWAFMGLARLRARTAAARPEQIAHVAGPAVAGLFALGVVLVPFAHHDGPTELRSTPPAVSAAPAPAASAAPTDPGATVSVAPAPSDPAVAPVPASAAPQRPSANAAPNASVGGIDVFTTPEGQESARAQAEQMPIYTPLGNGFLGVDPAQLVLNTLDPLFPPAPGAPS